MSGKQVEVIPIEMSPQEWDEYMLAQSQMRTVMDKPVVVVEGMYDVSRVKKQLEDAGITDVNVVDGSQTQRVVVEDEPRFSRPHSPWERAAQWLDQPTLNYTGRRSRQGMMGEIMMGALAMAGAHVVSEGEYLRDRAARRARQEREAARGQVLKDAAQARRDRRNQKRAQRAG